MTGLGSCCHAAAPTTIANQCEALCLQVGALLILDEVMTSRLAPGGLQTALGIKPDLTTLGKYLGGGLSFGAFGGRADVMAMFDPREKNHVRHAGTFNNNALTMAAGYAGLAQVSQVSHLLILHKLHCEHDWLGHMCDSHCLNAAKAQITLCKVDRCLDFLATLLLRPELICQKATTALSSLE